MRRALPLLLTPLLGLAVLALGLGAALREAGAARALALAAVAVYVAWVAAEGLVATRPDAGRPVPDEDRGTLEPYAVARAATALAAPALAGPLAPGALGLGLGLLALGALLRLRAIAALGVGYSHRVRAPGALVTGGVYRLVRHPAYAGMLLAHAGWAAAFASLPAAALLALGLVPAVVARIVVEERALAAAPGWAEYASGRARLLPGVF
ncbi:MAG: isoprenylcysteine carboxylmethyltransferase family protein [Planctomycetes bacterium]|nr:isoprenylcysteine carboxylmethyltransferase family protein [Planctomycetota bacterium]